MKSLVLCSSLSQSDQKLELATGLFMDAEITVLKIVRAILVVRIGYLNSDVFAQVKLIFKSF